MDLEIQEEEELDISASLSNDFLKGDKGDKRRYRR